MRLYVAEEHIYNAEVRDYIAEDSGLQKDRDRGTRGPKEGWSPIGRFGLKDQLWYQLYFFLNNMTFLKAKMILINP